MITDIRLENFKCFRELTKFPLKKVKLGDTCVAYAFVAPCL